MSFVHYNLEITLLFPEKSSMFVFIMIVDLFYKSEVSVCYCHYKRV